MTVIDTAAAKVHLRMDSTEHDDQLEQFIASAEATIAEYVGPLEPVAVTRRVVPAGGWGGSIRLPVGPAIELTTVTPADGAADLDVAMLHVEPDTAVVTRNDGAWFPARYYDVTYQAGRAAGECPEDLKMAVLELLRHIWTSQRGGGIRPAAKQSDATANTVPGAAYLLPFRVEQLIAPHVRTGFA